ncbi:unnamed protein product [Leuciscus chuanchicus]
MGSTVAVLLFLNFLSAGLFTVGFGDEDDLDCRSYTTSSNENKPFTKCQNGQHCCGSCNNRYCCSSSDSRLTDQDVCNVLSSSQSGHSIVSGAIWSVVASAVFFVLCCCCCIYKMCRTHRSVPGTHITTVMNTQCIQQQQQQQPAMQPAQYPAYQPVPTQPGYGAQPMQTGPYQGQPYAPGPPPPYHIAASPGYPGVQAAYDGSQATYPMMPPAQPGSAYPPPETFSQPAYNPSYMQPPNTGY